MLSDRFFVGNTFRYRWGPALDETTILLFHNRRRHEMELPICRRKRIRVIALSPPLSMSRCNSRSFGPTGCGKSFAARHLKLRPVLLYHLFVFDDHCYLRAFVHALKITSRCALARAQTHLWSPRSTMLWRVFLFSVEHLTFRFAPRVWRHISSSSVFLERSCARVACRETTRRYRIIYPVSL